MYFLDLFFDKNYFYRCWKYQKESQNNFLRKTCAQPQYSCYNGFTSFEKKEVSKVEEIKRIEVEVNHMIGRVKWFNNDKGYGFIDYKKGEDVFVHYSTINCDGYKTLSEGQYVEFTLLETSKGYQAVDVTPVKEPAIVK